MTPPATRVGARRVGLSLPATGPLGTARRPSCRGRSSPRAASRARRSTSVVAREMISDLGARQARLVRCRGPIPDARHALVPSSRRDLLAALVAPVGLPGARRRRREARRAVGVVGVERAADHGSLSTRVEGAEPIGIVGRRQRRVSFFDSSGSSGGSTITSTAVSSRSGSVTASPS